jgi:hypothetical protein
MIFQIPTFCFGGRGLLSQGGANPRGCSLKKILVHSPKKSEKSEKNPKNPKKNPKNPTIFGGIH